MVVALQLAMLGAGFFLMSLRFLIPFYVGIPLVVCGQSILRVVITSRAAGLTSPHMKGEVIGTLTSLMAASMVIVPIVAGALFEMKDNIPYLIGFSLMVLSLLITPRVSRA